MAEGLSASHIDLTSGVIAGPRSTAWQPPAAVEWIDAAHPFPDAASEAAGRRARALAEQARRSGRLVIVLLSGGSSSMLALPASGITLDDKARTAAALMRAGVDITGLNCVRKHLSAIKGGWLGVQARRTATLAISDVHSPREDDPAVIGSGPTVADPTTFDDALQTIEVARALVPGAVLEHLRRGARGALADTPKPGDPRLDGAWYTVVGNRRTAQEAAAADARARGYEVEVVAEAVGGEARAAGPLLAQRALDGRARVRNGRRCVIAAGETTVRVKGSGRGGRCLELALSAVEVLDRWAARGRIAVLASVGSDGIDGATDAAGALVDTTTGERAHAAGLDARSLLDDNASYDFFAALGDLVVWGPTGTNVGDLQVLLIE